MAINLGTSPYYDDFDIEKNFHRILFKPGYAVQARELTQLQTILQNQIERFGNHVFKNGSVVLGCPETFQFSVPYVKIKNENSAGITISSNTYSTFQFTLVNATVSNEVGVTAKIILVELDPASEQRVLYLNYQTASLDGTTTEFLSNDVLTVVDSSNNTLQTKFVVEEIAPTGFGSLYTIGDGIVYAEGNFIRHVETTKVLEYFSNTPSRNVGFRVISESITSEDDVSLLDPAAGSYNYSAPGADRYKLTTKLESYPFLVTPEEGFYLLFIVDTGEVKRAFNKPQYAELQKVLAQRTFDESGNYTVSGLNVIVREHLKTDINNGRYSSGDSSKILYGVEPGKAYVEGFDAELKATEYLEVPKATDTLLFEEKIISSVYGNYVYVKNVTGDWDMADSNLTVELKTGATAKATSKVRLLRHHRGTPGSSATSFYKLYLYDLVPKSGFTLDNLGTVDIITDNGLNTATVAITPGDDLGPGISQTTFTTHQSNYNTLIFPTTARAIVNYLDDLDYYFWKKLDTNYTTIGSSNDIDISISGTGQSLSFTVAPAGQENIARHFLVVRDDGSIRNVGTVSNVSGPATAPTSCRLTLTSPSVGNHTVYAYVKQTNGDPINLSLVTSHLQLDGSTFSGESLNNLNSGKIYLGVPYAYDVEAVYVSDASNPYPTTYGLLTTSSLWTNVTDDFELVVNQDDNVFNTSYIVYTGSLALNSKKVVIKFRNFVRDSSSGYINKNSYESSLIDFDPLNPNTAKQIYTYQLPTHKSKATGITYDLRDVIDFRPTVETRSNHSGAAYNTSQIVNGENIPVTTLDVTTGSGLLTIPDPESVITTSFTVNLPRKDKVILTREGDFKVITGVSSLNPQIPSDAIHAMTLAVVELAPYPSLSTYASRAYGREDYSAIVRLIDNRRFTMRDIGDLEQRVNRLEYYTALSIMENKVANMFITDSNGDAMIKKGILVDGFDGHDVGNVFDTQYNVSIDTKNKEMRAPITIEDVSFSITSGGHQQGSLLLNGVTHTSEAFIRNNVASKSRICGNALLRNYKTGNLYLDPQQDMWIDETARPDVQVNYNNTNDGWEFDNKPFDIHWNGWLTNWQGVEVASTSPVVNNSINGVTGIRSYNESARVVSEITRSVINAARLPEHNMRSVGTKVLDISVVPYIRSQVVTFIATELKPNTIVKAYFDGEDVSEHCRYFTLPNGVTPATIKNLSKAGLLSTYEANASLYGDNLVVNSSGVIVGQFLIPANTFRAGSKIFKLEDVNLTTLAASQFQASGLSEIVDNAIFSTRFPDVRQDVLTSVQNTVINRLILSNPASFNASSYGDPMAQTFIVEGEPNGAFITKADLYFRAKSSKSFTIQIREVINGYPGNKIVPFSTKTLPASSILISETAALATTFTFDTPVYLKNNTEYALVLLPENNDPDYQVWVSEVGQRKIGTAETITQQPFIGVLFVPNNNTVWTALENEDLKFLLHKGVFETGSTTISLKSDPIDYITFSSEGPHNLIPGDVVKVYNNTQNTLTGAVTVSNTQVFGSEGPVPASTVFTTETKVGDVLRVKIDGPPEITGTSINGTAGSPIVTGTGFNDLRPGDILYKTDNTVIGKVKTIDSSGLQLTLEAPATSSFASPGYYALAILGVVKSITDNNNLTLEENYRSSISSAKIFYKDVVTAEGYVTEVENTAAKVFITYGRLLENDNFDIRTAVTGDTEKTTITVESIDTRTITAIAPNFGSLVLEPSTSILLKYKLKRADGTRQSTFSIGKNNETIELNEPFTLFSYSSLSNGEYDSLTPAIEMQAVMHTDSSSSTPVLDTKKLSMLVIGNQINYNGASEAVAQYITRAVTLDSEAEDLRVFMDIKMPENCSVRVYAKMQDPGDDSGFDTVNDLELDIHAPTIINRLTFQEYMFSIPQSFLDALAALGKNFQYNKFSVRVELYSGTNTNSMDVSKTPVIKNFRAVALI